MRNLVTVCTPEPSLLDSGGMQKHYNTKVNKNK